MSWTGPNSEPVIHTLAGAGGQSGSCNGLGPQARFNYPEGLWLDESNAQLLVSDYSNNLVRVVGGVGHKHQGLVSTMAGTLEHGMKDGSSVRQGDVLPASFSGPSRICAGANDRTVYILDQLNHRVRVLHFPDENGKYDMTEPLAKVAQGWLTWISLLGLICIPCGTCIFYRAQLKTQVSKTK